MCGIVGYIGTQQAAPILVDGLKSLEYRGYDSAGIALAAGDGRFRITRASGKLANLEARVDRGDHATMGIGHTRWATHGRPTEENAHPHRSGDSQVVAVHNGIFENFLELRAELKADGQTFSTETDTECFPVMVAQILRGNPDFKAAFTEAVGRMRGIYAIACLHATEPGRILVARSGPPLVIGLGEGENFIASDVIPLLRHTRRIIYLEDGDLAEVRADGVTVFRLDGVPVTRPVVVIPYDPVAAEKGRFKHFMQKEIFEQPTVVAQTLRSYVRQVDDTVALPQIDFDLSTINRVTIVACGTSYYAGLVAKYWFEQFARLPVDIDVASEFRYRDPVLEPGGLALFISQSGETADTLAALRHCKAAGQTIGVVVNVPTSSMAREADLLLPTHAGPEIGVASTKAFTCQLAVLAALAAHLAVKRGRLSRDEERTIVRHLIEVPAALNAALEHDAEIAEMAHLVAPARDVLYLGRGQDYPLALEGALKLKEISYIHAEGYASGEMKHGPIALIDENVPVIVIAPSGPLFEKTVSNMQEVRARGGKIVLISDAEGIAEAGEGCMATIEMPKVHTLIAPLVYAVPVQLLAYHVACAKGTDVDQPRNLAKSVTVE